MTSIFRFLALATLIAAFSAVSFAQDVCADADAQIALYTKFQGLYPKTAIEDRKAAVSTAKEYIEKYGSCPTAKDQVAYFKTYIPSVEGGIVAEQNKAATDARRNRFVNAVKAKSWDEAYAAGKELIANDPDPKVKFDTTIFLGSIGFDESVKNNDKYNDETLKYAMESISQLESGKTSDNFGYGIYQYGKNPKFPDSKANTLGWLNYYVAYIKNVRQKDLKGSIPYYYKVTKLNSSPKNYPEIYYQIGKFYYDQLNAIEKDREDKIKAAGNKNTDETKALFAQSRGYADRVLDAYARAYNLAVDKAAKDSVYAEMKEIYKFRYQGKVNAMDALIASTKTSAMPDPLSTVAPVIEVEPTPATTTTTGTTGATATTVTPGATVTTTTTVTPGTTTKSATVTTKTTTKPAAKTAVKPAAKSAAKKPAPKK